MDEDKLNIRFSHGILDNLRLAPCCEVYAKEFYEARDSEISQLKEENSKLKEFVDRFQTEYYLKNSATGMLELYSDVVEYEMNNLKKNSLD